MLNHQRVLRDAKLQCTVYIDVPPAKQAEWSCLDGSTACQIRPINCHDSCGLDGPREITTEPLETELGKVVMEASEDL